MNPETYAALYGPGRPARQPRAHRPVVVALAVLVWTLTALTVSWVGGIGCVALLWALGSGEPAWWLPGCLLLLPAGAAGLVALARTPALRAMDSSARMLLLGAVACPVPAALTVLLWSRGV
ncbi:hypothetical protein [Streptomyces sp. NPDC047014]|uniref:hypothetical protein n=1 Tax=Streptomyces sp. NPDC047014 TaxID=3155736 RepID=UPI00340EB3C7